MSLVKIYKYKIKPHTEEIYLELQEQVQNIYREYGEIEFTYLKDKKDFFHITNQYSKLLFQTEEFFLCV